MSHVMQWLAAFLMLAGAAFGLLAAVGVLRLPDILMRIHAATKAGTLGCGLSLLAVAIVFGDLSVATRAFATILFLIITIPVSAHMIGRAAFAAGVPLRQGTMLPVDHDELLRRLSGDPREPGGGGRHPPPRGDEDGG